MPRRGVRPGLGQILAGRPAHPENLLESRHLLAARILRSYHYGERDEWRLAHDALGYVRELSRFNASSIVLPVARKARARTRSGRTRPVRVTAHALEPATEGTRGPAAGEALPAAVAEPIAPYAGPATPTLAANPD
jgi:hypothetical protein